MIRTVEETNEDLSEKKKKKNSKNNSQNFKGLNYLLGYYYTTIH